MTQVLASRSLGQYPLSIGTSLAFESITGIHPDNKIEFSEVAHYKDLFCNILTLFRNIVGSLQKGEIDFVKPTDVASVIIQEMDVIDQILVNELRNHARSVFYIADYQSYMAKMARTKANIKQDVTDIQKRYTELLHKSVLEVIKTTKQSNRIFLAKDYIDPRMLPQPRHTKALIVTHIAYDLCSRTNFDELDLLETHTGKIKKYNQFHTKYTNGKTLPMIPFMKGFLPVFGDSEFFSPMGIRDRNEIIELAKEMRWTSVTTKAKIHGDLNYLKNKFLAEVVKSFF